MTATPSISAICARDGSPAAAVCSRCGDALCSTCTMNVRGVAACAGCAFMVSLQHSPTGIQIHKPWAGPQIIAFLIWLGYLLSYASYVLVARSVLKAAESTPVEAPVTMMASLLGVVALIQLAVAYLVWTRLPGWLSGRGFLRPTLRGAFVTLIVWVVAASAVHAVGLYGLVLCFMELRLYWLFAFMLPSALATVLLFPGWNRWYTQALASEWSTRSPDQAASQH